MAVHTLPYGKTPSGDSVFLYVIANDEGAVAQVTDLGACLVSLNVPNAQGTLTDVVLGYESAAGYANNEPNLGATVGRNANRVAGAGFELDGKQVKLGANEGKNNLHSGPDTWTSRVWNAEPGEQSVTFHLTSADGDQGFPGELEVAVTYTLTNENVLAIDYVATPSETTVVNLTNHSYFNLNGHASGSVAGHELWLDSHAWLPTNAEQIPTGEFARTSRTPMDFTEVWPLGLGLNSDFEPLKLAGGGYDHCFVLGEADVPRLVAILAGDKSGITMEVTTDLPGIQLYTANNLDADGGKGGAHYGKFDAVCLETQFYPDALHHADWPQPVFGPENPYRSHTSFRFGVNREA